MKEMVTEGREASALLATLESLGLSVRVKADGRLGVSPTDLLTPELNDSIRQHKDGLLGLVEARDCVRPEALWPGIEQDGWDVNPFRWESWTPTDGDTPDLPELVAWWDKEGRTAAMPLTLAPGVVVTDLKTLEGWVNENLTAGRRTAVAEQLRWLRRAIEARTKEEQP